MNHDPDDKIVLLAERDELRAKLDASEQAVQSEKRLRLLLADEKWSWRLRAEQAEAKLDASERANAEMRAALAPFAATEPTAIASIPRDKLWLWKPSRTGHDPPGISIAHIDAAKAAICSDAGRDYVPKEQLKRAELCCELQKHQLDLAKSATDTLVNAAWREGMTDARLIALAIGPCSGTRDWNASRNAAIGQIADAILAARDARKEGDD